MEQDNLFRYLDAKFDGVEKLLTLHKERSDKLEKLIMESMTPRIEKLEKWRYILTGASVIIFAILSWVVNQTPNLWSFLKTGPK